MSISLGSIGNFAKGVVSTGIGIFTNPVGTSLGLAQGLTGLLGMGQGGALPQQQQQGQFMASDGGVTQQNLEGLQNLIGPQTPQISGSVNPNSTSGGGLI